MKFYETETNELIQKYFPGAEAITRQKKGCAADYVLSSGEVIEVKLDKRAADTGNIFIEFEYTSPEKVNIILNGELHVDTVYNSEPSGIALSAERGYGLVIFAGNNVYKMPAKDLLELAKRDKIKTVKTAPYRNGNREGVSSSGYVLPISKLPQEWKLNGTK